MFWLTALFLLSLPFVNPWVRGDGVGYYAYARALLIDHDLNFEQDWLHGNASFVEGRVDARGQILPSQYTSTGHLDNHFSAGPALLWSPFLTLTHGIVTLHLAGFLSVDQARDALAHAALNLFIGYGDDRGAARRSIDRAVRRVS